MFGYHYCLYWLQINLQSSCYLDCVLLHLFRIEIGKVLVVTVLLARLWDLHGLYSCWAVLLRRRLFLDLTLLGLLLLQLQFKKVKCENTDGLDVPGQTYSLIFANPFAGSRWKHLVSTSILFIMVESGEVCIDKVYQELGRDKSCRGVPPKTRLGR